MGRVQKQLDPRKRGTKERVQAPGCHSSKHRMASAGGPGVEGGPSCPPAGSPSSACRSTSSVLPCSSSSSSSSCTCGPQPRFSSNARALGRVEKVRVAKLGREPHPPPPPVEPRHACPSSPLALLLAISSAQLVPFLLGLALQRAPAAAGSPGHGNPEHDPWGPTADSTPSPFPVL